jgi:hypothetical protein
MSIYSKSARFDQTHSLTEAEMQARGTLDFCSHRASEPFATVPPNSHP